MMLTPKTLRSAQIILPALFAFALMPALSAQSTSAQASDDLYADEDAQETPLLGSIEGDRYVSPTGAFRMTIPVMLDFGGDINDSQFVVSFQDLYGTHASIGCFPFDEKMRAEETTRGRKEFLVWFFQNYIQSDFMRSIPGTTAETSARYVSGTQGGALLTNLLLPDGSVFSERVFIFPPKTAPVAKRGNLIFVREGFVYVISTELAERLFEYSTYSKTATEEDEILRKHLFELLAKMTFTRETKAPAATIAPAPSASLETPAVTFPSAPSGTAK